MGAPSTCDYRKQFEHLYVVENIISLVIPPVGAYSMQLVLCFACAVEFSAAGNHLKPYTDDSLSTPDIAKSDETIDVVAVDRRMARPEIT